MAVTFTDYARHAVRHLSASGRILPFIPAACLAIIVMVLIGCGDKTHKQTPRSGRYGQFSHRPRSRWVL